MKSKLLLPLLFIFSVYIYPAELKTGADLLLSKYSYLIKNKRIGLVTNHTGVLSNGVHLADVLSSQKDIKLTALFGPEHGVRGAAPAGAKIEHGVDAETGIPVFSLYGKDRKPSKEMLKDIDVLIFDIQDVGARFYTYISTLYYILQAGAENNIPVIVLDRPNPIGGEMAEGPILKKDLTSFVGIAPIPVRHGMTVGELAEYFAGEDLLNTNKKPDLTVIKMEGWSREQFYDELGLKWIPPSPNIPDLETAVIYPGTCFIEGSNISEGRGTDSPFLNIGAPFINSQELITEINKLGLEGFSLEAAEFIPADIEGKAANPKHEGEICRGIKINIIDKEKIESVKFGIGLISVLYKLYPGQFTFREQFFDKLAGTENIRKMLTEGKTAAEIFASWTGELNNFIKLRQNYLLY